MTSIYTRVRIIHLAFWYILFISALEGYTVDILTPENSCSASPLKRREESKRHIIFTAETHNFPTGNHFLYSITHEIH